MFTFESDGGEMGLKPMNCPSTIMIFKSRKWSYRDLPVRFADFDKLYRNEISGALTGLFRVREMTQDDAHLFVRPDQVEQELVTLLKMIKELYGIFGLSYTAKLSTMPDNHLGDEALWDQATASLKNALKANGMEFGIKEKDGAFYGPKIDFEVKDSMGREWQCATVQLDYQLPKRFGLDYTGEDGKEHEPVMIHRVILRHPREVHGRADRALQGRFPTWLAPVQVQVVSISDQTHEVRGGDLQQDKGREGEGAPRQLGQDAAIQDKGGADAAGPLRHRAREEGAGGRTVTIRDRNGKQTMGIKLEDVPEVAEVRDSGTQVRTRVEVTCMFLGSGTATIPEPPS